MTKTTILMAAASALALAAAMPAERYDEGLGLCFKRGDATKATTFATIYKVDAETRKVYGRLADETPDMSGEIFDYDSSAPHFRAWSEKALKASGGKSAGNLRVMHGLKVAGIVEALTFDDAAKTIDIVAEVVDDAEWLMVEKGCYTGFSLGGRYLKKWADKAAKKTRYTVNPFEASLVDVPCIPTSTFDLSKADGVSQVAFQPWAPTAAAVAAKAAELAGPEGDWSVRIEDARKALEDEHSEEVLTADPVDETIAAEANASVETPAADAETPPAAAADTAPEASADGQDATETPAADTAPEASADGQDATETPAADTAPAAEAEAEAGKAATFDPNAGLEQGWRTAGGEFFATKAEARDANAKANAKTTVSGNALAGALASLKAATAGETVETPAEPATFVVDGAAEAFADFATVKALYDDTVTTKGVYDVRTLASLIQELSWLTDNSICEAGHEQDGSAVPGQLMANLRSLSSTLVTMAREETAEMIAQLQQRGVQVRVFEGESTKTIEVTAGMAAKADAAATPASIEVSAELLEQVATKFAALPAIEEDGQDLGDVSKALGSLREENAALKAQVEEAAPVLIEATKAIGDLRTELDALKAEPMPSSHTGVVVGKAADSTPGGGSPAATPGADANTALKGLVEQFGQQAVSAALIQHAQGRPVAMSAG